MEVLPARVLAATFERARAARPGIHLDLAVFAAHVTRHVGAEPDVEAALASLHAEDLYLACACARGDAVALAMLEEELLGPAIAYARRAHGRTDGVVDEAGQRLRMRLLVREPEREPQIASYPGRSPLGAWLRLAAVREARGLLRRPTRETALAESHLDVHLSEVLRRPG